MTKILSSIPTNIKVVVVFSAILLILGCSIEILEPFFSKIMVTVLILFTTLTFDRWLTALMSVAGLGLFGISFLMEDTSVDWASMIIWVCGVYLWAASVLISISRSYSIFKPQMIPSDQNAG